uniref:Uncharacterized protein n=1 Tax=Arundo donax TaxID=35708 RepID=A0A0A8YED2_ARUDO
MRRGEKAAGGGRDDREGAPSVMRGLSVADLRRGKGVGGRQPSAKGKGGEGRG